MTWNKLNIKTLRILEKFREWIEHVRQDRNLIMFLIFLVISTGFWFLNALRKDYTATLNYPVKLVNLPEDKMLSGSFEERLEIKVRAGGFVILRYQLSNTFLPLTFDVSEMKTATLDDLKGAYALTNQEESRIVGQLSQGMELIEISPDTLFVPLMERGEAKVPVKMNTQLNFEKQHLQAGPVILNPDSVTVSGPKPLIDTLQFVSTRKLVFENLTDTIHTSAALVLPREIESNVKKVTATIPVEPFTELNVRVPLRFEKSLPDSLRIKTFPSEIQVSFRVGISKYETVDESQFRAVVDVAQVLKKDRPDRLKVRLDRVPQNVETVSFSPIFVEYLIEKRK